MVGKHEGICGVHSKANTVTGPSKSLKALIGNRMDILKERVKYDESGPAIHTRYNLQ